jgi:hypothetical protein
MMRSAIHLAFTVGGGFAIGFAWLILFPVFLVASLAFVPRPFAHQNPTLSQL